MYRPSLFSLEEKLMYENKNLEDIVTPINAEKLKQILDEFGYDPGKTEHLVSGFRIVFSLGYCGNPNVKITSPNLKLRVGSEVELWNKVMKEVKALRYAGPF